MLLTLLTLVATFGACLLGVCLCMVLRRLSHMRADLERAHLLNKAHEQVADFTSASDLAAADESDADADAHKMF